MSQQPVITLFETFGAGAETIGRRLAETLGVQFAPQSYSSKDLEDADTGLEHSALERMLTLLGRSSYTADLGHFSGAHREREAAAEISALRELAAAGVVVMGRSSTVILEDFPQALHVKLDAPLEVRIARGAAAAGISLDHARSRQQREDSVRAELAIRLHNWDPRKEDHFDLVVNTGTFGDEAVVQLILAAFKLKNG